MTDSWIKPVVLESELLRLEPLQIQHTEPLAACAAHPEVWRYMPVRPVLSLEAMREWVEESLALTRAGGQFAFAILLKTRDEIIGSTRYMDIRPADRGVEIGWTWITPSQQRTGVNTHCKYLLLRHAFEDLGAIRVQLKTDGRNVKSQTAIQRLGAVKEGILRKQVMLPDGYVRDTVYYSILQDEWPSVKMRLEGFMARAGG